LIAVALTGGGDAWAVDPQQDDGRVAADLLPGTVVAYAEAPRLGDAVELVVQHPLRKKIESMPVVAALLDSNDFTLLRQGLGAFEGNMGQPWNQAIASVTDQGVHFAFDGATQGAVLLIKSSRRDQLESFNRFVLALAQLGNGNVGLAKSGVYRGFTAYALQNDLKIALVDHWFLMTNKPALGQSIIDRYLDGGDDSLSGSDPFASAMKAAGDVSLKAYVDLDAIREAGVAPKLYSGKTDNVAAEALLGGILANLKETPYLVSVMNLAPTGVQWTLSTPHENQWSQGREYFFGEDGNASAPPLLEIPDRIFAVSSYRDLSQMWLLAPDLMTDKANEDLAKADTNLTTFFSGRDFGEDILGSLKPEIQLVVGKQDFADQSPQPSIKLPAFAIQFRMRTPEETTREFRRVFQNVIGFINVVGAMQGQPQLDLGFEQSGGSTRITATYVPPPEDQDSVSAPINFNFSPTLAFAGDRMVISSSSKLARTLTKSSADSESNGQMPNTRSVLSADGLVELLRLNKAQLVAQNMLEKGHGPEQADAEIGVLFDLLGLFDGLSIDLDVTDGQLQLTTKADVKLE
jgi:hypothetical protein